MSISVLSRYYNCCIWLSRLQVAIYFKNCITKRWCLACNEYDPDNSNVVISIPIDNDEKATIRTSLLSLLVSSPDAISKQLIESDNY